MEIPIDGFCHAIVCYKCDSISFEGCATTLNDTEIPYEDCGSSTLWCATAIVDNVTYRGCSSSTPSIGASYRKTCQINLCNKGVYPPGRMKCHQCSGEGCQMKPMGKPHPCLNFSEDDACYLDIRSPDQVYRGCKSDRNHTISDRAIFCDYNGCNDASSTGTLKCAHCDSHQRLGCKMDLTSSSNISQYEVCEMKTTLDNSNTCFIYKNLDHVVRGCSDRHMTDEMRQHKDRLTECTGHDLCNSANMPFQQCLVCNSESGKDDDCRFTPSLVRSSYCGSPEASSCFAVEYENWHVERGCGRPPKRADINRQYECDEGKECNATPFVRCYKCSTEHNSDCAAWQRPGFLEIEECQNPGANCVIATFTDDITKRGCETQLLNCTLSNIAECQSCQGSFCNRGSFPPDRLHCYQCGTEVDDCKTALAGRPTPCPKNELQPATGAKEGCYEYFSLTQRHVVRGCASNTSEYYKCMLESGSKCKLCNKNGCNNNPMEESRLLKTISKLRLT
ncbi:uncharacterized protein LOC133322397 [Musca vetustissima]|uniref:uncharacterized protein LOC133322397 n=1 Tax=Musca vetustissima TaxID=27455 RepID=UPI002AB73E62|nr:uncharacterized protein LOC133322397 [Musca vetustissima]